MDYLFLQKLTGVLHQIKYLKLCLLLLAKDITDNDSVNPVNKTHKDSSKLRDLRNDSKLITDTKCLTDSDSVNLVNIFHEDSSKHSDSRNDSKFIRDSQINMVSDKNCDSNGEHRNDSHNVDPFVLDNVKNHDELDKMKGGESIEKSVFGQNKLNTNVVSSKDNAIDDIELDRSEKSLVKTSNKDSIFDDQSPLVSKYLINQKTGVVSSARVNKKVKKSVKSPTLPIKRKLCTNLDQKSPKSSMKKLPKFRLKGKIGSPGIKPKNVNSIKNYFESMSKANNTSKADNEVKIEVENIDANKKVKVMDKVDAFERLMMSSIRGDTQKITPKRSFKRTRGTPSEI